MRSLLISLVLATNACGNDDQPQPPADLQAAPTNPLSPPPGASPANPLAPPPPAAPTNPLATPESVASPRPAPGTASAIEIGRTYEGPMQLSAPSTGLRFTLPAGWQAQAPGGIPILVLATSDAPSMLALAWSQRPANEATVREILSEPLELGEGAAIQFGTPRIEGGRITCPVQARGGDGRILRGSLQGIIGNGAAAMVMAVGADSDEGETRLSSVAKSMRLEASPSSQLAGQLQQLRSMLAGTRLERVTSENFDGGFASSSETWDFCGDGQCRYAESSTVSVSGTVATDTGSGVDELGDFSGSGERDGNQLVGRWSLDAIGSIAGEYLQVTVQNQRTGEVQHLPILPTEQGVDFAGRSWSALESPLCQ